MALDSPLDALIRRARAAEDPSPPARARVRQQLELRIARGSAEDGELEAALSAPGARPAWPRALAWFAPAAGLGLLAIALALPSSPIPPPPIPPPSRSLPPLPLPPPAPAASAAAPAPAPAPSAAAPGPAAAPAPAAGAAAASPSAPPSPASPRPAPSSPAPSSPAPSLLLSPSAALLAESQALARVQRALRDGDPRRALTLLDAQEREFAAGALAEERAAARVLALCNSGNGAAARSAANAFVERYPGSVLAARVRGSCALPPAPGAAPLPGAGP